MVLLAPPIGGEGKTPPTKIRPKVVGSGIFCRFQNFDKCRSEAAGDAISGLYVDYVGMDVCVTLGESWLNTGRIIRLFGRPTGRTRFTHHLCPVFNCILQPTGSSSRRHIRQIYGTCYRRLPCEIWCSSRHQLVGKVKRLAARKIASHTVLHAATPTNS